MKMCPSHSGTYALCSQGHEVAWGERVFELGWHTVGNGTSKLSTFCARCLEGAVPRGEGAVPEDEVVALAVVANVAGEHGYTVADLREQRRDRSRTAARHQAMLALRRLGYSEKFIGYVLWRDHTTVHYGLRQARKAER